jgi:hypothetical protein
MNFHPGLSHTCMVVLIALFLSGCHSAEERARLQREEQNRQDVARVDREIAEDSTRFGAVTDWPSLFRDGMFTVDIEPIFIRPDHRPILFIAFLDDTRRENGQTMLYFSTAQTADEPKFRLILDCAACDLSSLRESGKRDGEFEVIADIASATKLLDIPLDDTGTADPPKFVLHGRFIQARFVDDYTLIKGNKS